VCLASGLRVNRIMPSSRRGAILQLHTGREGGQSTVIIIIIIIITP
jgi:hypothetical protein